MWKFYGTCLVLTLTLFGAGNHQAKGACTACALIAQDCKAECNKRFTGKAKDCEAICSAGGHWCLMSEEEIKEKVKTLPPKE